MQRLRLLLLAAAAAAAAAVVGRVAAHASDPAAKPVVIGPHERDVRRVVQVVRDAWRVVCELRYTTQGREAPAEVAPVRGATHALVRDGSRRLVLPRATSGEPGPPLSEIVAPLRGSCVARRVDFWDYEVCFFDAVRQLHAPSEFSLGERGVFEQDDLVFRDGADCEGRVDRRRRETRVRFACSRAGNALLSIEERELCEYAALVATPLVCAFDRFAKANDAAGAEAADAGADGESEGAATPFLDSTEEWLLQATRLDDGRFMCTASRNHAGAGGKQLQFASLSLNMLVVGLDLPPPLAAADAAVAEASEMRAPAGHLLAPAEYELASRRANATRQTQIKTASGAFGGAVALARVFA